MSRLLILDPSGTVIGERILDRERLRIGRRPDNDIVLDDLSVSSEHALVITIRNDSFIQDLNSMNGVRVNGRLVRHHHLQADDEISLGSFTLKYIHEPWTEPASSWLPPDTRVQKEAAVRAAVAEEGDTLFQVEGAGRETTLRDLPDTEIPTGPSLTPPVTTAAVLGTGHLRLLAGPGAGRETALTRPVTTLGKPGIQTAVISRRGSAYYLSFVEGETYPQVNGVEIGATPHLLNDHDILDVAGTRLEFFYR